MSSTIFRGAKNLDDDRNQVAHKEPEPIHGFTSIFFAAASCCYHISLKVIRQKNELKYTILCCFSLTEYLKNPTVIIRQKHRVYVFVLPPRKEVTMETAKSRETQQTTVQQKLTKHVICAGNQRVIPATREALGATKYKSQ